MEVRETKIPDVLVLSPKRFEDERGFFSESWSKKTLIQTGIKCDFVQDNHSFSKHIGTMRGLHFQYPPFAQAKLVRSGRGSFLDVAVDIRVGSPTFGKWVSEELSFENGKQLFIPEGFLHGFITQVNDTEIIYKCNNYYSPEHEGSVVFNDPEIGVDWGNDMLAMTLSDKDKSSGYFCDIVSPFQFEV